MNDKPPFDIYLNLKKQKDSYWERYKAIKTARGLAKVNPDAEIDVFNNTTGRIIWSSRNDTIQNTG